MNKFSIIFALLFVFISIFSVNAQVNTTQDSVVNQPKYTPQDQKQQTAPKQKNNNSSFKLNKLFFGGGLGVSFGSVTTIRVNPLIGYSVTPKLSAGISGLFEYTDYSGENYSNYGGSVFGRFRVIPQLYAHAEFSYINYEFRNGINSTYRQGVPFIWLGGGYAQRIGRNTYAYAQILFDVLQDSNSPYLDWEPFYSVGVSVGF